MSLRPSVRRLVAYLVVQGAVDRGDTAARLFEDLPVGRAMGNLRTVLWRAREEAPGLIAERRDCLELSAVAHDLAATSRWCDSVLGSTESPSEPPPGTGQELLPMWDEAWVVEAREPLRLRQLYALEAAAGRFLLAGRLGEAVNCALLAASLDPLRESAQRILIEVLLREGNAVDALRRYRRFETLLAQEANARPGFGLQALIAPVLASGVRVPEARSPATTNASRAQRSARSRACASPRASTTTKSTS